MSEIQQILAKILQFLFHGFNAESDKCDSNFLVFLEILIDIFKTFFILILLVVIEPDKCSQTLFAFEHADLIIKHLNLFSDVFFDGFCLLWFINWQLSIFFLYFLHEFILIFLEDLLDFYVDFLFALG